MKSMKIKLFSVFAVAAGVAVSVLFGAGSAKATCVPSAGSIQYAAIAFSVTNVTNPMATTTPYSFTANSSDCTGNNAPPIPWKITIGGTSIQLSGTIFPGGAFTNYTRTATGTLDISSLADGTYTATLEVGTLGSIIDPVTGYGQSNIDTLTASFTVARTFSSGGSDGATIGITSVAPNPATNAITVSGSAGGGTGSQGIMCPVPTNGGPANDIEEYQLSRYGYRIDGGSVISGNYILNVVPPSGRNRFCGVTLLEIPWSYSFSFPVDVSVLGPGPHTVTVCASDANLNAIPPIICDTASFTKTGVGGIINVSSTNAANNQLIPSSWVVTGPSVVSASALTQVSYPNMPAGTYITVPTAASAGTLYALRGVEQVPAAKAAPGLLDGLLALSKEFLFKTANAYQTCSAYNLSVNTATDCTGSLTASLSIVNNNDALNFIILWDPIGTISATPAISFVAPTLSGPIALTNNGAPGSTVTNLRVKGVINYISGPSNWLTVGSLSGITLTQGAGPTNVTLTANPPGSACDPGCTATLIITGDSAGGTGNANSNLVTVTVTTSVGGGGNPSVVIVSPTPAAAGVPVKVDCQGGSAPYTWSGTGSPFFSNKSADGSSIYVQYDVPNTYTLTCTDKNGLSDSAPIVITPDCTLTASPTKVVPPQQSVLSWSCVPGTAVSNSCSLAGSSGLPTAGTMNVAPAQTTSYTLSCDANNAIPGSKIPPTQVIVTTQGPGVIETNP